MFQFLYIFRPIWRCKCKFSVERCCFLPFLFFLPRRENVRQFAPLSATSQHTRHRIQHEEHRWLQRDSISFLWMEFHPRRTKHWQILQSARHWSWPNADVWRRQFWWRVRLRWIETATLPITTTWLSLKASWASELFRLIVCLHSSRKNIQISTSSRLKCYMVVQNGVSYLLNWSFKK